MKDFGKIDFVGDGGIVNLRIQIGSVFPTGDGVQEGYMFWLKNGTEDQPYTYNGLAWTKIQISDLNLDTEVRKLIVRGALYSSVTAVDKQTVVKAPLAVLPGMSLAPAVGSHLVNLNAQYSCTAKEVTLQAISDLNTVYLTLTNLPATMTTHVPVFGAETLNAGVYTIAGAGSIAGTLTLDAQNNPDALFVFRIGGAFTSGAGATVLLVNGALAANVFWVVEGAGALAAVTNFKGTIITHNAALSMGDSCILEGRLFSTSGALAITNATITTPAHHDIAGLDLGILETFCMFTASGALSNTGVSYIIGDLGTNLGAVTGFEVSTVQGTLYTSGMKSSLMLLSIYQNNVLIPNSTRIFNSASDVGNAVMQLQTIASTASTELVTAKIKVLLGIVVIGNRNFTALKLA